MKPTLVLLSLLLSGCDRADELLASAVLEALADPAVPRSDHAADCAKGAPRMAAPDVILTIDCERVDAGRRTR